MLRTVALCSFVLLAMALGLYATLAQSDRGSGGSAAPGAASAPLA